MSSETDVTDVADVTPDAPPPPSPPRPVKGKGEAKDDVSESARRLSNEDDRSIYDWLHELGGGGTIRIKLARKYPKTDRLGNPIAGFIDEFDEPFSELEIKRRYGGGKYQAKTERMGPRGNWVFAGARTFEIEGAPKMEGVLDVAPGGARPVVEDDNLSEKALDHMARTAELNQRRAWQLEDARSKDNNRGFDPELLRLLNDPPALRAMQQELIELRRQAAAKDEKMLDMITEGQRQPPIPSVIEKTFEHMVAGESGRIEALRTQHESERRMIQEHARNDIERERTRIERELESRDRAHEREIGTLRETHGQAMKSVETSYEARIDGLKGRISDLERQLTEAKTEMASLRAIKDKGPLDAVEEVAKLKNALEVLSPSESEPASVWERILGTVMQSPLATAVANRVENAPPAQPNPQEIQRRRRAAAAAAARGETVEGQPGQPGTMVPTRKKRAPRPGEPAPLELNPIEVAAAITFIETTITGGKTDPVTFANSIRTMIPQSVLRALRELGPDEFINVAKPPDGSVLYSQLGRTFLRKTARALLGQTDEPAAPPPAEAPAESQASPAQPPPTTPESN